MKGRFTRCETLRTEVRVWSVECRNGDEPYMWGDAVQIQIKETKARALSICEVEVYAETYGKNDDLRFLHVMLKKHLTTAYTYQIYIDIQEEEMTVL